LTRIQFVTSAFLIVSIPIDTLTSLVKPLPATCGCGGRYPESYFYRNWNARNHI